MDKLTLKWDDRTFQLAFANLATLGANTAPLMADIAEGLLHSTQDRFDTKVAPDGTPWAPLSPRTQQVKRGPGILVETGLLVGGLFSDWGPEFAEISAPAFYARWQQDGTKPYKIRAKAGGKLQIPDGTGGHVYRSEVDHPGIPARPFMGISTDDVTMILGACEDAFARCFAA